MKITFDFNKEDIWNYGKHITFNIPKFKRRMIINIFMVPILVIVVGYIRKISIPEYIFYVGGFSLLYVYVLNSVLKSKMIKINSDKGGPLGEHTIELSNDAIIEKLPERESIHNWNEIIKIDEDKKYYYIQWNETSAHVIPKRVFPNLEEAAAFYNVVKGNWNNSKNKA